MKKILGLVAGVLLSTATMAQSGVTFNDAVDGYNKTTAQTFHFSFSSHYTVQQITEAASYYVPYFTVETAVAGESLNVSIKLVEDTGLNRRIVNRFFSALEVADITVNGTTITRDDFVATYIML